MYTFMLFVPAFNDKKVPITRTFTGGPSEGFSGDLDVLGGGGLDASTVSINVDEYSSENTGHNLEAMERYAREGNYHRFEKYLNMIDFKVWTEAHPTLNRIHLRLVRFLDYHAGKKYNIRKCYDILRANEAYDYVDVNYEDEDKHCALYYAANSEAHDVITSLLNRGASLGNVDTGTKRIILEFIPLKLLEQHFDSCIELKVFNYSRVFKFDYKTLYPSVDGVSNKFDAISRMVHISEFHNLLTHPIISSFIYIMWEEFKHLNYDRTIWYAIFTLLPVVFIFLPWYIFLPLLLYPLIYIVHDFCLTSDKKAFFKEFKNWVNMASLLIYLIKIFTPDQYLNEINACMFIPMILQMLTLLEYIDNCSIYIIMFRIVALNFIKLIVNYTAILLSIAFCYYCIRFTGTNYSNASIIGNFTLSLFNTVLLLPAEYRLEDMNFNFLTGAIFMLLVLFTIILINLMNALAFSDTLKAREEAELLKLISRIQFIQSFLKYRRTNVIFPVKKFLKFITYKNVNKEDVHSWVQCVEIWNTKNQIKCREVASEGEGSTSTLLIESNGDSINMKMTWMWTSTLNRARNIVILREQALENGSRMQDRQQELEKRNQQLLRTMERSKQYVENSFKRIMKHTENDARDIKKSLCLNHLWTITAILQNMGSKVKYEDMALVFEKQYKEATEFPFKMRNTPFGELLRDQMKTFDKFKEESKSDASDDDKEIE